MTSPTSDEITVLVYTGERRRPVRSSSSSFEALKAGVLSQFADVLPANFSLIFQVKDDKWGGMFVDIVEGQLIPDRSVVKVVIEKAQQEIEPLLQVCPTIPSVVNLHHILYAYQV